MELARRICERDRLVRAGAPGRLQPYDGAGRAADAEVELDVRHRWRCAYIADRAGRPRPGPGVRRRRPRRSTGDLYTALRHCYSRIGDLTWPERLDVLRELGRSRRCAAADPPPEEHGDPAVRAGGTPRPATPRRSATTTTSPTLLRVGARPLDGLHVRGLPDARTPPSRRRSTQKFDLVARKLGLKPGHAPARRRLRLGRHGHPRRQQLRRAGARRDAVARSRRSGRRRRSPSAGLADLAEVRFLRLPRRRRDRVRRGQLHRPHRAHRHGQLPSYFSFLHGKLRPGAGCSTTASPARPTRDRRTRRVHRPLRLPGRRADRASARSCPRCRTRLRDPARGEPARALRA